MILSLFWSLAGVAFAAAPVAAASGVSASGGRCSYATLAPEDQRHFGSRYRSRLRMKGKAAAEQWVRDYACPLIARRGQKASGGRVPTGRDGQPCRRTRMEMRAVTSMDGSMTMAPKAVCAD